MQNKYTWKQQKQIVQDYFKLIKRKRKYAQTRPNTRKRNGTLFLSNCFINNG